MSTHDALPEPFFHDSKGYTAEQVRAEVARAVEAERAANLQMARDMLDMTVMSKYATSQECNAARGPLQSLIADLETRARCLEGAR